MVIGGQPRGAHLHMTGGTRPCVINMGVQVTGSGQGIAWGPSLRGLFTTRTPVTGLPMLLWDFGPNVGYLVSMEGVLTLGTRYLEFQHTLSEYIVLLTVGVPTGIQVLVGTRLLRLYDSDK